MVCKVKKIQSPSQAKWSHKAAACPFLYPSGHTSAYAAATDMEASALHDMAIYMPTFAGSHYAYSQREGQGVLIWD